MKKEKEQTENRAMRTMVCVTVQRTCERLIREGARGSAGKGLFIVHVAHPGQSLMGASNDPGALEFLYETARLYGAEMFVTRASDITTAIVEAARKNDIERIVIGASGKRGGESYALALRARLPGVTVSVV